MCAVASSVLDATLQQQLRIDGRLCLAAQKARWLRPPRPIARTRHVTNSRSKRGADSANSLRQADRRHETMFVDRRDPPFVCETGMDVSEPDAEPG
jgi:hypothetical protein